MTIELETARRILVSFAGAVLVATMIVSAAVPVFPVA